MIDRPAIAGLACALVALVLGGSALAQDRPSTSDMQDLSAVAADRLVRRDLLSVLEPTGKLGPGMLRQFRQVGFLTRPVGSAYDGLCQRDFVSVRYAPTTSAGALEDQPLKPSGVEVGHSFHVVRLPTTSTSAPAQRVWSPQCTGLSRGEEVAWFGADDAEQAARAANWIAAAAAQAKAGTLPIVTCNRYPSTKLTCAEIVSSQGDMSGVTSVASCRSAAGLDCLELLAGDARITVVVRPKSGALDPKEIVSVAVEELLFVT